MKKRSRPEGTAEDSRFVRSTVKHLCRMLLGAGIVLSLGMLSGCAELLEQTHVAGTDNDAFFPFIRGSIVLSRDKQADAASPDAPATRSAGPSLQQGNVALDIDLARVEGEDTSAARQRTFDLNFYSLALRGSTRPEQLWGLYLEGLVGLHHSDLTSRSPIGAQATDDETGLYIGFGAGYAFTDRATVHMRSTAGTLASGAVAMQEVLATYWFTRHVGLSGGYRSWQYANELIIVGYDFRWRGPAAGLVVAF